MKTCHTNKGHPFLVDDADYPLVSLFKWYLSGVTKTGRGGAIRTTLSLGTVLQLTDLMSRRVGEVDHINGNPFDNRRQNLRLVTRTENQHFKCKRLALERLHKGIKCSLKICENQATSLVRLPKKRYLYLCDEHFVTNKHRGQGIDQ